MLHLSIRKVLAILFILILFVGIFIFFKNNPFIKSSDKQKVLLFEAAGCTQCQKVESFLKQNNEIENDLTIQRKESEKNKLNALDLKLKANLCHITIKNGQKDEPLLYDSGTCIVGDQQIIDYLTELAL
jgi:lipopolysaccharide export LptBFGC system permease protein LptF